MAPTRSGSAQALDLYQDLLSFSWSGLTMAAAFELDVFGRIASGKSTAAEVAAAAGAAEHGMRRLLDALCGLGYLRKNGQRYALQRGAAQYLVRGGPFYLGDTAAVGKMMLATWATLAEAVRLGRAPQGERSLEERSAFFARLVPAIFPGSYFAAVAAVKRLPAATRRRIARILDIGAGAAAWSIPFARALKRARVTVIDYPAVTKVTREYAARWGVGERYEYLEGDFREVDLGSGYDLAILGHIIHGEGADLGRRLLRRTCEALAEGGMLLIGEFVPNDQRSGPAPALLFGLNMLIHTPAGDVFTMREYREWLKEAGFRKVTTIPAPHVSPLILATK